MFGSIHPSRWLSALVLVVGMGSARAALADDTAKTGDDAKDEPKPGLHLAVTPSLDGPWKMVVANTGDKRMRVLADARLLTLEIVGAPEPPQDPDAKDENGKPKKKKPATRPTAFPRGKIPVCKMPPEMRPPALSSERALVLEPGDSYEETFDPVAFCGAGPLAGQLGVGAVVYATLGFPDPHPHRPKPKNKGKKGEPDVPDPPYLAESLKDPPDVPPIRVLEAQAAIVMPAPPDAGDKPTADATNPDPAKSDATKTDAKKTDAAKDSPKSDPPKTDPPKDDANSAKKEDKKPDTEVVDERAPRVEVTTEPRSDAGSAADVTINVTTKNVGKRMATLHLRTDDLAFRVVTPTGRRVDCNKEAEGRAAVRDFFETLREGHKKTLTSRLREVCPTGTFHRPGVYSVTPRLVLHDSGAEYRLTALVAVAEAKHGSKIRVRTGPLPYHATKPQVAKRVKPEPVADDDDETTP